MVDEEVPKIVRAGYSYSLSEKTKYSKKAGADEDLFDQLRADGVGDIVRETVAAQTLQSTISAMAEDNDGELPPQYADLISVYNFFDISRRRATK